MINELLFAVLFVVVPLAAFFAIVWALNPHDAANRPEPGTSPNQQG